MFAIVQLVTIATKSLSWVIIETKFSLWSSLPSVAVPWDGYSDVLSDTGPQNAVVQSRSTDRCSASKADCVAVVNRCISAAPVVVHHTFIFNSFVLCTHIHFQDTAFGFQALQVQVVLKRLLLDLLLDHSSWISSSYHLLFENQKLALENCINCDWTPCI